MRIPVWGAWLLGLVAILTACGYLIKKIIVPAFRFARSVDEALPPLRLLAEVFAGEPNLVKVIHAIANQFKTDSGSSLRDVVNRLEQAAIDNKQAAGVLAIGVESSKQMADVDRKQVQNLIILLDRLTQQVGSGQQALVQGQQRIEGTQTQVASDLREAQAAVEGVASDLVEAQTAVEGVASDLVESQKTVEGVASDLTASHKRADKAKSDIPGESADAASQSPVADEDD